MDWNLLLSMVAIVLTLIIFIDLVRMQAIEAVKPRDHVTADRYIVLVLWALFLLTLLPISVYLYARLIGVESEVLRSISTVAGRIGPLAIGIGLEIFYRRRR